MKITNQFPNNWKELQDKVCKFLNEAGYPSESPKTIDTVRGKVEVDVFSTSETELIKQFICECKFWNTPIPKEKIHAFRTIVHDSGSMVGIFISKEGYQSGAYEAAYCSNVLLKDWNGFIELIEKQWITLQLYRIKKLAHPLSVYTDPLDVPTHKFSCDELKEYNEITSGSIKAYLICRTFDEEDLNTQDKIEINGQIFTACDELFDYLQIYLSDVIKKYERLFEHNPVESWKLECPVYTIAKL